MSIEQGKLPCSCLCSTLLKDSLSYLGLEILFYFEICGISQTTTEMYYETLNFFHRYLKIIEQGILNTQKMSKLRRAKQSRERFFAKMLNDTKISAIGSLLHNSRLKRTTNYTVNNSRLFED